MPVRAWRYPVLVVSDIRTTVTDICDDSGVAKRYDLSAWRPSNQKNFLRRLGLRE